MFEVASIKEILHSAFSFKIIEMNGKESTFQMKFAQLNFKIPEREFCYD